MVVIGVLLGIIVVLLAVIAKMQIAYREELNLINKRTENTFECLLNALDDAGLIDRFGENEFRLKIKNLDKVINGMLSHLGLKVKHTPASHRLIPEKTITIAEKTELVKSPKKPLVRGK